jgi:erythromycin esterase
MTCTSALCLLLCLVAVSATAAPGCGPAPVAPPPRAPTPPTPPAPPTLVGAVLYDDGTPASGALIAIADPDSGGLADLVTAGPDGRYHSAIAPGSYALAVTGERGFAWIEKQSVPDPDVRITLSRSCHALTGRVTGGGGAPAARINLERQSLSQGDTFVAPVRTDGGFTVCLPEGQYRAFLTGGALSVSTKLELPATHSLAIRGVAREAVQRPPPAGDRIHADLNGLVADIIAGDPRIIGLGEATHGTAELVSARSALTFELIRRAGVRLVLFELDAIAGATLDDYVNGADVDPAKAVAALGFWVTDTHEFLQFLAALRDYNATVADKVHIWGIDLQNTTLPVNALVADADALSITADDQALLKLVTRRGKGVKELSVAQRSALDTLLSRLAVPRGASQHDLVIAVAARSLAMQLEYWTGDMGTWYRKRRDLGMASLASFLVTQLGVKRACLWAHDNHISKQPSEWVLGHHLAQSGLRYYAVGFYLHQGTARAWDPAGKVGVISHPIPAAPDYTVESAVMRAAGLPEIAWLALRGASSSLAQWLATPRFVRELGAVYRTAEDMMVLHDIKTAFDAVVVVRTGHDSSPTATGVRTADKK